MTSIHHRLLQVWRSAAEAGRPLPSEANLATSLQISRPKVREELIRLESDGLVTRVPNSGTFPNRSALNMGLRLDQSYEFSGMLRAAGYEATVDVLETSWCRLAGPIAQQLGLPEGHSAFQTTKRWSADGTPVMVAVDTIPANSDDRVHPDGSRTVFQLVEDLRGSSVAWENSWVLGKNVGEQEAEQLGLTPGESVLGMTTIGVSVLGTPLYVASETYRQGVVPFGLIRNVPASADGEQAQAGPAEVV